MNNLEGKKKTLTDKIFGGSKENQRPLGGVQVAYGELEVLLEKVGGWIGKYRCNCNRLGASQRQESDPAALESQGRGGGAQDQHDRPAGGGGLPDI